MDDFKINFRYYSYRPRNITCLASILPFYSLTNFNMSRVHPLHSTHKVLNVTCLTCILVSSYSCTISLADIYNTKEYVYTVRPTTQIQGMGAPNQNRGRVLYAPKGRQCVSPGCPISHSRRIRGPWLQSVATKGH